MFQNKFQHLGVPFKVGCDLKRMSFQSLIKEWNSMALLFLSSAPFGCNLNLIFHFGSLQKSDFNDVARTAASGAASVLVLFDR